MQRGSLYSKVQLPEGPDFIRLVRVNSDLATKRIKCQLETVRLSQAPPYFALSYTWQSPFLRPDADFIPGEEDHTIECNGEDFKVYYNLYEALLRVGQEPFEGRYFWIDRISIDQSNTTERSAQVDLMAEIFQVADEVIVWLGPGDEHLEPANRLMTRICSFSDEDRRLVRPENLSSDRFQRLLGSDLTGKDPWIALSQLFRRNWFGRGWVVQEVLYAKKIIVLCGDETISWEDLKTVSDFLATTTWTRAFADPGFLGYDRILPYHNSTTGLVAAKKDLRSKSPFLYSLIRTKRHTCQMPIDKVFSLYGIARMATPPGVRAPRANYDLQVSEAYTEATVNILQSSENLHVLAYAEGSRFRKIEGLPSWVPDWSCRDVVGLGITGYKRYHASSRTGTAETEGQTIEFGPDGSAPTILRLRAAFIDKVSGCGESKREVARTKSFPGWLKILESLDEGYSSRQSRVEAFWRTIVYDTSDKGSCPAQHEIGKSFQTWVQGIEGLSAEQKALLATREGSDGEVKVDTSLWELCFGHRVCLRLFRTEMGFLGLGTESLEVGDQVWLVPGSRVPLLFRERDKGKRSFELVGGTYVHGLMHGEALDGVGRGEERRQLNFQTVQLA